jgi:hypothetical protein
MLRYTPRLATPIVSRSVNGLVSVASAVDSRWSGVDGGRPSSDLLGQLDNDSLGAADIAEPVAVLVAHQLADELGAAGL